MSRSAKLKNRQTNTQIHFEMFTLCIVGLILGPQQRKIVDRHWRAIWQTSALAFKSSFCRITPGVSIFFFPFLVGVFPLLSGFTKIQIFSILKFFFFYFLSPVLSLPVSNWTVSRWTRISDSSWLNSMSTHLPIPQAERLAATHKHKIR